MPHLPETDRIRLDNPTLEERAKLYPQELQEPFIWLGCYVREDCNRDLDLLVHRAGELKINTDKTNWSKILRGRWNRDAHGNEVSPCVALEKLLKHIDTLRKDSQVKEQGGRIPFVMTPTAQLIYDFILMKRAPDRVNKIGIVVGETGTQKTATFREFQREHNHGTTTWMDSPERPNMYRFKTELAAKYGAHVATSMAKKEAKIEESLNWRKILIIENIQRLYVDKEEGNQEIFNYLQTLLEKKNFTLILSFTPTFEKHFTAGINKGFFEQFVGRAGGVKRFLRLPQFPTEADVDAIAKAFRMTGLKDQTTWPLEKDQEEKVTVLEYLTRVAREPGRIRRLFEDLQDAKIDAEAERKPLTIAHVKTARGED